jgi:hypothetical protein
MNNDFTLGGKIAVVTGACKGNGQSLAAYLETLGAIVERTDIIAADGIRAMDVTDEASVREGISAIVGDRGRIDILVNNAGVISKALVITGIGLSGWRTRRFPAAGRCAGRNGGTRNSFSRNIQNSFFREDRCTEFFIRP